MTRQEMLDALTNIGTCEDDIERRGLIATLQDSLGEDYDELDNLRTTNATLTSDNERIREENMKLFLRVSEPNNGGNPDPKGTGIDTPPEKRKFEDLFNEKGEIK